MLATVENGTRAVCSGARAVWGGARAVFDVASQCQQLQRS